MEPVRARSFMAVITSCRCVLAMAVLGSLVMYEVFNQLVPRHAIAPIPRSRLQDSTKSEYLGEVFRAVPPTGSLGSNQRTRSKPPLSQEYHRRWDVNCSALFAGNKTVINTTNEKLRQERGVAPLMPLDSSVVNWTRDCGVFRSQRGYPRLANSQEEASFPLAYIIVIHTGSAQVERLLRAIYQPQNIYCIHPDATSPRDFQQAISGLASCFDNVFIASRLEDVYYTDITRVLADINCMRDLTGRPASGHPWKYVINLCGQDFPLKTNLEIVRGLRANSGRNSIESNPPPIKKQTRTKYKYKVIKNRKSIPMRRTERLNAPIPHNLTVFTGSAYYAVTKEFVLYVLRSPVANDLLVWLKKTFDPDETYWATLQRVPGTPGGGEGTTDTTNEFRFVLWTLNQNSRRRCHGKTVHYICIFANGDLQLLHTRPEPFANKFYYSYDPVTLQCLERVLDARSRQQMSRR